MASAVVFMANATKCEAQEIVHVLNHRLLACASILGPVESRFWWKENIDKANELPVLMKSDERFFRKLSQIIKQMHSYEVPEIIALLIYEEWPPYIE